MILSLSHVQDSFLVKTETTYFYLTVEGAKEGANRG